MSANMEDILKLARVQLIIIPIFIFFKIIRPSILDSGAPSIVKTILLSLPNFFEAITGILVLTGIGLLINSRLRSKHQIEPKYVYFFAVVFTGVLVFAQELNFIQMRTNSTFDIYDLFFSIIGLIVGYYIILKLKPKIKTI